MKTIKLLFVLMCVVSLNANAQNPRLAVLGLDNQVKELSSQNLTELLRIQISKHNRFEVVDRYEVTEVLAESDQNPGSCLSKSCLVDAGKKLKVNKVVSGSIDQLGESLYIRLRLMDIKTETVDKEIVKEYLYIPEKIGVMLSLAVNELLGLESDQALENSLTSKSSYESAVNNPHYNVLQLSGPRMGYTFITGEAAGIMALPKSQGGYDAYPALFQFGYQFEKQYLNEGKFQALFEFIPMISGLDQGMFIPSLTVMNGLRNNVNGIEFAIGPSINFIQQSRQFQDPATGEWHRVQTTENVNNYDVVNRMDSRGEVAVKSYVVLAAGFSLKSGKMNIPINAFVIPAKETMRFGFSFGFNARG
ncbi:MAG: hypothetical protein JXR19_09580 [Bacteroidia bacterium]